MSIAYDHDVLDMNDPFVEAAEEAIGMASLTAVPGGTIVNSFPIREFNHGASFHGYNEITL